MNGQFGGGAKFIIETVLKNSVKCDMVTSFQRLTLNLLWLSQARSWIRHQIPLLGSIIAGRPELQEGRVDGCIDIDPTTLRLPKNARTFALKASASWDRTIKLWDVVTGKEIVTLSGHLSPVHGVAFSPDGTRLASGSMDCTIKLWDPARGKETATLSAPFSRWGCMGWWRLRSLPGTRCHSPRTTCSRFGRWMTDSRTTQ